MPDVATKLDTYRFDQMAVQVKDKVHPDDTVVERYVGLEHIDPESLKIRRWGEPSDVESTKILFRAGDIIFGKRRAYQRKLAVADFEGICSAHAMVLRPRTDVVLKEFLPFFMQTDTFMERAVKISVGGLSPSINWRDLAKEEFALPPIEEQRAIAQELMRIEVSMESYRTLSEALEGHLSAITNHFATAFGSRLTGSTCKVPAGWTLRTIGDLCDGDGGGLTLGPFGSSLVRGDYGDRSSGVPVIFVADVRRYAFEHSSKCFISDAKQRELKAHEALPGDLLVTEMGWPPGEACIVPSDWRPSVVKADIIRARLNHDKMLPRYLEAVLNSYWGMKQLVRISPGTTRPRMTLRDFREILVATPGLAVQKQFVDTVSSLLHAIRTSKERRQALVGLKSTRLSEVWRHVH